MKTSLFDMTFVLPPLVEMTEVVKDVCRVEMTAVTILMVVCGHNC